VSSANDPAPSAGEDGAPPSAELPAAALKAPKDITPSDIMMPVARMPSAPTSGEPAAPPAPSAAGKPSAPTTQASSRPPLGAKPGSNPATPQAIPRPQATPQAMPRPQAGAAAKPGAPTGATTPAAPPRSSPVAGARTPSGKGAATPPLAQPRPDVKGPAASPPPAPAGEGEGEASETPSHTKTRRAKAGRGRSAAAPTKSKGVRAAGAGGPRAASGNRLPLMVLGAIVALLAIGAAIYCAFPPQTPQQPEQTADTTPNPPVPPANADPGTAPTTPALVSDVGALDRANRVVHEAEVLEGAHHEADAIGALDAALDDSRTAGAKRALSLAKSGVLARFKSKLSEASEIVARGDLPQARALLADLKARCPDALLRDLLSVQTQLEGALARRPPPPTGPNSTPSDDSDSPPTPTPPTRRPPAPTDRPPERPPVDRPPDRPVVVPKPDPDDGKKPGGDDGGNAKGGGKEDETVAEKARAIRSLLFDQKVAEAAKLVPELERLAPDSPVMRAVRGMVAYDERRYADALEDLAAGLANDSTDDFVRDRLASGYFLFGHYDEAREVAKASKSSECERLVYLIDGPWAESFPLGHTALEQKTPNGHFYICSDLGLELGATDTLERDLGNAPSAKRPAMLKKFHDAHPGLKELVTNFEAAYKAYAKLFKIGTGKEDKAPKADPKKDADPLKGGTVARDAKKDSKVARDRGRVTRVYVFREKEAFASFSSKLGIGSTEHILGYFMPSIKILAFYREQSNEEELVTRELHNVLFHETFHQFLDLFIADSPPWFNEGLAEYFGISELSKDGLKYGLVPDGTHGGSRYTNLQEVISPTYASMYGETCPTLFALMKLNHSDFMVHGAANYAMAWGLVHFFASTTSGQKKLKAYFRGLRDGVPKEEIFRKVFGDMDQPKLEADFRSHVGDMAFNRPPPDDGD
jgi:hypothetical protein